MSSPTKRELQEMLRDVEADLRDIRRREADLEETLTWIKERLAEYPILLRDGRQRRSVGLDVIRDYCRGFGGRVTAQDLARYFSISVGQARAKLDKLWEQNVLVKIKPDSGPTEYEWEKPDPTGATRLAVVSARQPEDAALKVVPSEPVARTGRSHPNVKRRRAYGQKGRSRRGIS